MPKALTKTGIAGLACLAAVSVASVNPAAVAATSEAPATKPAVTNFGYNANAFGTKIVVDGTEIRTLKDALINRPCTRRTGLTDEQNSLISSDLLPESVRDLIKLDAGASKSTTETYRDAATNRFGVRGTNTLLSVGLGNVSIAGLDIPGLSLNGLQSVADSFYDAKAGKFGTAESFGFDGLTIDLVEDGPISDTLGTLFDAIGVAPEDVYEPVNVLTDTLVQTLDQVGVITIPGLGQIALGSSSNKVGANFADSDAYALKIDLYSGSSPTDSSVFPATTLQLGRANAQISRPVKAGVFRSRMSALEANVGNLLSFGGIGQRTVPCQGTGGKVVTRTVAAAGVPGVANISGIVYKYKGLQQGKKASGFVSTTIGQVSIPAADIVLKGITSRVDVTSSKPNKRVTSVPSASVGELLIGGQKVALPKPGKALEFQDRTGQTGILRFKVLDPKANSFFGKHLTAVQIVLPGDNVTVDLGVANGEVFFL